MQPLTQGEIERLKNSNIAKHYQRSRKWYVQNARNRIIFYIRANQIVGKINPGSQQLSKAQVFELVKCWLENEPEWNDILLQKKHIPFKHYDLYTDTLARLIIQDAYSEITS